ncbi:hypothetical protein Hsar01_01198 [Haloferula sargassicola]|uniref:Uncharacterized protein n=1 Tax=Haloferula sargassicola TaxID=490096 RepID=A0ABP9UQA3_9BACT
MLLCAGILLLLSTAIIGYGDSLSSRAAAP